jgi:hypothetical protein
MSHKGDVVSTGPCAIMGQGVRADLTYPTKMDLTEEQIDVIHILASNLTALMEWSRARGVQRLGSIRGLARYIEERGWSQGVTKSTIARMKLGQKASAIDTVECVARAYDLQVWQLLVPDLKPGNPPVIWMTETERAFYQRMESVAREFLKPGEVLESPAPEAARADRPGPSPSRRPPRTKSHP